jgi:hypothetical protein
MKRIFPACTSSAIAPTVSSEPRERAFDGGLHARGRAVRTVGIDAELRADERAIAAIGERFADDRLAAMRTVHFGRIEERDAEVERPVNRRDRLAFLTGAVRAGKRHAPETEFARERAGCAETPLLHRFTIVISA